MSYADWYFTPTSLGYLTQGILGGLITAYLLAQAKRLGVVLHVRLLTVFFGLMTLFALTMFWDSVSLPTMRLYALYLENGILAAALVPLLQFTYHYPHLLPARRVEARVVLVISLLYVLTELGVAVYRFYLLLNNVQVTYRWEIQDYWLVGLLIWLMVSLVRQFEQLTGSRTARACWRAFFAPSTRETEALRSFFWAFVFIVLFNATGILFSISGRNSDLSTLLSSLGLLIAMTLIIVTYLNAQSELTSFNTKVTAITLTVMMAVFGVLGWVVTPGYQGLYRPNLPANQALRWVPNAAGGYDVMPTTTPFDTNLGQNLNLVRKVPGYCHTVTGFDLVYYGQVYDRFRICLFGFIQIQEVGNSLSYLYRYANGAGTIAPLLGDYSADELGNVYLRQTDDKLIITWHELPLYHDVQKRLTFQAHLYRNGIIEFVYLQLPEVRFAEGDHPYKNVWFLGLLPPQVQLAPQVFDWRGLPQPGGPVGLIQDYNLEFRQHLHNLFLPLSEMLMVVSVFVVLFMPLFFEMGINRPLRRLLDAIKQMERGNYQVNVAVQAPDEIGIVTHAFNTLAKKLHRMVYQFEHEVELRTHELSNRSEQLNILNLQLQDQIWERERAQATVIRQQRELAALEERETMARELHDGQGQILGYIYIQVQAVQNLLAGGQYAAAQANLQKMAEAAVQAQSDLRQHILGLRNHAELETETGEQDFFSALITYAQTLSERYGTPIEVCPAGDLPQPLFNLVTEKQVLHIVKEALSNAAKHANASRIEVELRNLGEEIEIVVSDDGVGFDVQQVAEPQAGPMHFGLKIMQERAQQVGGRVEIRSLLQQGTRVRILLPNVVMQGSEGQLGAGVRVLLADDHPLFLDGLANLLRLRGITVLATAQNGLEAVEKTRQLQPEIAILDLGMPICDGVEATRIIKTEMPQVKVVILTMSEDTGQLVKAMQYGASGYLLKSLDANRLTELLVRLQRGELAMTPETSGRLMQALLTPPRSPQAVPEELTARQWEVLRRVADGKTYKEIGAELFISEKAVKYHMAQVMERLRAETRNDAVLFARRFRQS